MYVIIQNPDGSHETASESGQCFREAFDSVLRELKKGALIATIYAETPTDAEFGGLGEHLNFTGGALPLMSFLLGAKKIGASEETSSEIASLAGRIMNMELIDSPTDPCGQNYNRLLTDAKRVAGSALTQTPDRLPAVSGNKIIVPTEIDYDKVTNAVIGSIESGYSPWFSGFRVADDDLSGALKSQCKGEGLIWYAAPGFWAGGGSAQFEYDIPDEEEGNMNGHANFGKAMIQRGLQIMAAKYPRHFANLMGETDDAETHDVFMQCAVLEDVIYG